MKNSKPDLMDGILFYERKAIESNSSNVIWDYPEILVSVLDQFQKIWGIPETAIPSKKQGGKYDNWVLQLEKLRRLFSSDERMSFAMKYAFEKYQKSGKNLLIHEPASIYKTVVDAIRDLRLQEKQLKIKNEVEVKTASPENIRKTVKDLKNLLKSEDD